MNRRTQKISIEQRKRVVAAIRDGATYSEVAKRFGVSDSRIGQIVQLMEPKINRITARHPEVFTLYLACQQYLIGSPLIPHQRATLAQAIKSLEEK